jgi:hypothetical protein
LVERFINLELLVEKIQLQKPSSYLPYYTELKPVYVKVVEELQNRLLQNDSVSTKKLIWKNVYSFSDLNAPIPKESKITLKSGKVKKIYINPKHYLMETDNFFDTSGNDGTSKTDKKRLIKKPLVLLKKVKDPTKGLQNDRPQDLELEDVWELEVKKVWSDFIREREEFEKRENEALAVPLLFEILTAFQRPKTKNKEIKINENSIKMAALWDLVRKSVLKNWENLLLKEYYEQEEKPKYNRKQKYKTFSNYKKDIAKINYIKALKDQIVPLPSDFDTYFETIISKVTSEKKDEIAKVGKRAIREGKFNYVSEPIMTALLDSKCLIFENRKERTVKEYEEGSFFYSKEFKKLNYNTVRLNLNLTELYQKVFDSKN